jgi:hypothetical protein
LQYCHSVIIIERWTWEIELALRNMETLLGALSYISNGNAVTNPNPDSSVNDPAAAHRRALQRLDRALQQLSGH